MLPTYKVQFLTKFALSVSVCMITTTALAQKTKPDGPSTSPGYYKQIDQKLGALLSIYDTPSETASVVVQLPGDTIFNSSGVQRKTNNTLWQKVSIGEIQGWVRSSALKIVEPISFSNTTLPILGICGGTEPSWTIEWNSNTVTYSNIMGLLNRVPFESVITEENKSATRVSAGNNEITLHLTVTEKQCTFTSIDTFVWGEAQATIKQVGKKDVVLQGCCRPVSDGYR
ncbi:SH3 domain-containing protein [Pseudovibrio sp. Tun.PSC04-5.I4]|uniref:SH3 domain-containing protein n=1 Tax=Pseudovibrio sp. Tun.PSC04-5.I4 TaxID=1798213 RepID=UPI00087FD089|nr:SH3 domain-containing protein [Pseudovibrio sp. Tun.PSC04-5.I4]SDR29240.1 hypothetical protein SAMN04515695_4177 [Pseudovibrio sp. Tun.PSC04-5.I4]